MPAILDLESPANWISQSSVAGFPSNQFVSAPRMQYDYSDHCHLESKKSIAITLKCSGNKTFETNFRVFHVLGNSGSKVPSSIIGRQILHESRCNCGLSDCVGEVPQS